MNLRLNTNTKLKIAQIAYRTQKYFRSVFGNAKDQITCKRMGLNWELNLREGIDLAIYLFNGFEKQTFSAIQKQIFPGAIVLDIGANIGAHALPMAKTVTSSGKVYAIEPTLSAFTKLSKNKSLNPELTQLIPINAFLTDSASKMPSHLYSSWDLFEKDIHAIHGGVLQTVGEAKSFTLDELSIQLKLSHLDFIKMDVDGFECIILRGGIRTILKFKPKIIFELGIYTLQEQFA